jgi:hypothetical protein
MITSKILGKSYKTKATYKTQINKYEKMIEELLIDLLKCKELGWRLYLGDPILPQIRECRSELSRVGKEKTSNL